MKQNIFKNYLDGQYARWEDQMRQNQLMQVLYKLDLSDYHVYMGGYFHLPVILTYPTDNVSLKWDT